MSFSQSIIDILQQRFLIRFQKSNFESEDRFAITFAGDESGNIAMNLLIKSDSRLKISLKFGNFAAEILEHIKGADEIRKKLFIDLWKSIGMKPCCKIRVIIDSNSVSTDDFMASSSNFATFSIEFESFPFYDPEDGNRLEVVSEFVCQIWAMILTLIPYTIEGEPEGSEYEKTITAHERNPINRQLCIRLKGYACAVCGMKFEDVYGQIGKDYIEVHHVNPISNMGEGHVVNITNELVPLCSNCHSMIHRRRPPYSVAELKEIIKQQSKND